MDFLSATLANFLGSLAAGSLIAWVVYRWVTRRMEILLPAEQRRAEVRATLSAIDEELAACAAGSEGQQETDQVAGECRFEQLPTHAWDAARESSLFRLLPVGVTSALFDAYRTIGTFNKRVDQAEDAFAAYSTTPHAVQGQRALEFHRALCGDLTLRAPEVRSACRVAREKIATELGTGDATLH